MIEQYKSLKIIILIYISMFLTQVYILQLVHIYILQLVHIYILQSITHLLKIELLQVCQTEQPLDCQSVSKK